MYPPFLEEFVAYAAMTAEVVEQKPRPKPKPQVRQVAQPSSSQTFGVSVSSGTSTNYSASQLLTTGSGSSL